MFKQINRWLAKKIFEAVSKQTPVNLGDLVRHNLTGFDGKVIAVQYQGWRKPICRLTVQNNMTGRFISNIDRNEFTHAVQLRLIHPKRGFSNAT